MGYWKVGRLVHPTAPVSLPLYVCIYIFIFFSFYLLIFCLFTFCFFCFLYFQYSGSSPIAGQKNERNWKIQINTRSSTNTPARGILKGGEACVPQGSCISPSLCLYVCICLISSRYFYFLLNIFFCLFSTRVQAPSLEKQNKIRKMSPARRILKGEEDAAP